MLGYAVGLLIALLVYVASYVSVAKRDYVAAPALADMTVLAFMALLYIPSVLAWLTAPAPGSGLQAVFILPRFYGELTIGYFITWIILSFITLYMLIMAVDYQFESRRIRRG